MAIIHPRNTLGGATGNPVFEKALKEGKLVLMYLRSGKVCYRTYDPNRKPSKKEKAARKKFTKFVRDRAEARKEEKKKAAEAKE